MVARFKSGSARTGPTIPLARLGPISLPELPALITIFVYSIAQGLSSLLEDAEIRGLIHGAQICRGALKISHFLFADDSVFFFRASEAECLALNNILSLYERALGQVVNFNKSRIFYNYDVHERKKLDLSVCLGVSQALNTSSYLGLPTLIGMNKKYVFRYVQSWVWERLQKW